MKRSATAAGNTSSQKTNRFLPNDISVRPNTVMVVVPDSNRILFSSTQLTTFQTVSSQQYSILRLL